MIGGSPVPTNSSPNGEPPLTFDGRVAIVTGAGGGLGRCHALELARRGASVVVNDLGGAVDGTGGSSTAAEAVVAEIEKAGGEAVPNADSVATAEGGRAIVQTALDAFGRVDVIVNNAGILRDASFKNMAPDMADAVLDVHLRGAFNVTRPAWPLMREQGYGRVITTSSGAGLFGNFGQSNYGAAKMGLVGLTRVLAVEGAKAGIAVNAIAPIARTRMTEEILGPIAEKLDPDLVSPLVAYLAHETCAVNGRIYSVGGGRVARVFVGVTRGLVDHEPTAERIAASLAEIDALHDFIVPAKLGDEIRLVHEVLA
jgi:NAD(P)-dependent dehydrogenase (short-subunit alcohol dehydrogenase family)